MKDHVTTAVKRVLSALLDFLFPPDVSCLCCGEGIDERAVDGVCPSCCEALDALEAQEAEHLHNEPLPEGIAYVHAAYPYTGQARRLILALKFSHVRAAAVPLSKAMAMLPGGEEELLVPVPTTKRRLRERGFNQAALLCEGVAKELGMPMENALSRSDDRIAQSKLPGQSRGQNIAGTMRASGVVYGKQILLIDDVYTTGSTAAEAARALYEAGAVSVGVFTAARSLHSGRAQSGVKTAERSKKSDNS